MVPSPLQVSDLHNSQTTTGSSLSLSITSDTDYDTSSRATTPPHSVINDLTNTPKAPPSENKKNEVQVNFVEIENTSNSNLSGSQDPTTPTNAKAKKIKSSPDNYNLPPSPTQSQDSNSSQSSQMSDSPPLTIRPRASSVKSSNTADGSIKSSKSDQTERIRSP